MNVKNILTIVFRHNLVEFLTCCCFPSFFAVLYFSSSWRAIINVVLCSPHLFGFFAADPAIITNLNFKLLCRNIIRMLYYNFLGLLIIFLMSPFNLGFVSSTIFIQQPQEIKSKKQIVDFKQFQALFLIMYASIVNVKEPFCKIIIYSLRQN